MARPCSSAAEGNAIASAWDRPPRGDTCGVPFPGVDLHFEDDGEIRQAISVFKKRGSAHERTIRQFKLSNGGIFVGPVLLALVEAGCSRDDAYRMVQRNAMKTWDERRPFLDVLREDAEVTGTLPAATLEACFDLKRAVANVGRTFDVLDATPA